MGKQTFAAWVAPVASVLSKDRGRVIAFARSAPAAFWRRPSAVDGWTYHDILSHLAGGNDLLLQKLLRAAIARQPPDPALFHLDTDAENARGVEARRGRTLDALVEELERDRAEVLDLLARLADADRDLRWSGFPLSLGQFLRIVEEERHDRLHLDQMRAGLLSGDVRL